jgi:serine/threonine protein kinase
MEEMEEFKEGSVIGNYHIVRLLGHGGSGTVYEVKDRNTGNKFALKTFTPRNGNLQLLKNKFLAEAKLLLKLDHPNIVKVYDSGIDEETNTPFFVMEEILYKDGASHTLNDIDTRDLDEDFIKMWFSDLASALDYIHAMGIVHRDIKCGNVLIRPDKHIMLSDFGISKIFCDQLAKDLQITRTVPTYTKCGTQKTKFMMGTAGYMAPEILRGEPATRNSDVYSLGVLLFRLLTGVWYEPGTGIIDMLEMYEYRWNKVIPWMLAETPKERPYKLSGLLRLLPKEDGK